MWKNVPLRDPVVVYRFGLETNVPAVNQKDLWMADLSAKLLLGLSGDNWKSSEADSKSPCKARRLGSYSQMNPDMHSERMDISARTQLFRREGTLNLSGNHQVHQPLPSKSLLLQSQKCSDVQQQGRHRRVGSPAHQRSSRIVFAIKVKKYSRLPR